MRWTSFLLLLILAPAVLAAGPGAKPGLPLHIELRPDAPPTSDGTMTFTVEVTALVDAPEVSVRLTPSDDLLILRGQTAWRGAMAAGDARFLTLVVRLPNAAAYRLAAQAQLQLAGRSYGAHTEYPPPPSTRDGLRAAAAGDRPSVSSGIREYRLQP